MNKNQRIATILNNMAMEFQQITKILLEIESVPSAPPVPTRTVKQGMEWSTKVNKWVPVYTKVPVSTPLSDNAGRGTWGQALADSNKSEPHTIVHCVPSTQKSDGSILGKQNNVNCKGEPFTNINNYKAIHSNTQVVYYKCVVGRDAGTVLSVSKKTNRVVDDGRWNGKTKGRLAMVTTDNDGHSYARQMVKQIRQLVPKRTIKLHRNYRPVYPNGYSGPKRKFCAVYTESEWGNY